MNKDINENDVISITEIIRVIKYWFSYLKGQIVKLFFFAFFCGLGGLFYALYAPISYTAKLSFVVEEGRSGTGGLASLVGQFGLDISGATSTGLISGDNLLLFLKSKSLTKEVLLSTYDSASNFSLADKYSEVYELRKKWAKSKKVGYDVFFPPNNKLVFSRLQDSLLHIIIEQIIKDKLTVERPEKKATFIVVQTDFYDEKLSALFCERLVKRAINTYIKSKTNRQQINVDRLQRRADSFVVVLNKQTYSSASNQEKILDVNPAEKTAMVTSEVSVRDKMMLTTIYGEVVKNLEVAKVQLSQETPTIQQVDNPEYPLIDNRKSKTLYSAIFSFIGLIFISIFFILKKRFEK
jgi:hypothetical protein